MTSKVVGVLMLAACACGGPVVVAQPVWRLDVAGAEAGLTLFSDSQATAFGSTSCLVRDYQPLIVSENTLVPLFAFESEVFDFGASAVSAPRAVGAGSGNTDADSTSVVGVRGLGTPEVVVYFRASTRHTTTQTSCTYRAAGHAEVGAAIPLEILGESGAAYRVNFRWEFGASAATPYEAVAPNWPEDGIICSGGADLTCPLEAPARLFNAGYITGYHPERTSAPITGAGSMVVSPGWSGAGVYPDRRPILFVSIGAVVDDVMTNPRDGGGLDSCAGEFGGRLTLTIGTTVAAGACCRPTGCLVTTPAACTSALAGTYRGDGEACTHPINQLSTCCGPDINGVGGVTVQDIFDFLNAYFAGTVRGDFNASGGASVQDIFDFLAAYFTGCG